MFYAPRQSRFRGTSVVVVTEDESRALEVKKESSGSGSVVVCSGSVVVEVWQGERWQAVAHRPTRHAKHCPPRIGSEKSDVLYDKLYLFGLTNGLKSLIMDSVK